MPILVRCSACRKSARASDQAAGKRLKCPHCGEPIAIPSATPAPGPTTPEPQREAPARSRWPWIVSAIGVLSAAAVAAFVIFASRPRETPRDQPQAKATQPPTPDPTPVTPKLPAPAPKTAPPKPPETPPQTPEVAPPKATPEPTPVASGGLPPHSTWEGMDGSQLVALSFVNGECRVRQNGLDQWGKFTLDTTATPARLDVDWRERGKIQAIVAIDGETMRVEGIAPGAARPAAFTNRVVLLRRDRLRDAKDQALRIQFNIGTYYLKNDRLPKSLEDLRADLPQTTAEDHLDPWGKPYRYDPAGKRVGAKTYSMRVGNSTLFINPGDVWTTAPDGRVIGNFSPKELAPVAPESPKENSGEPTKASLVESLANRAALAMLLKSDRRLSMNGLSTPAIDALSRLPGIAFERRAAAGLLVLDRTLPTDELQKSQWQLRFALGALFDGKDAKGEVSYAKSLIALRLSEVAVLKKEGPSEPLKAEADLCWALVGIDLAALAKAAQHDGMKELRTSREFMSARFAKALDESPNDLATLLEAERLLEQAADDTLRAARVAARKRLVP